jgi:hypothetical protein
VALKLMSLVRAQVNLQLIKLLLRALTFKLCNVVFYVLLELLKGLIRIHLDLEVQLLHLLQVDADRQPKTSVVASLRRLVLLLILAQRLRSGLGHGRQLLLLRVLLLLLRVSWVVEILYSLRAVLLELLLLSWIAHVLLLMVSALRLVVLLLRILLLHRLAVHGLLLLRIALLVALVLLPLAVMLLLRILVLVGVLATVRGRSLLPRVLVHIGHTVLAVLRRAAISDHFNHSLRVAEALELFNEGLVDLRQVQLLLAVRQLLQLNEVAVRHLVGIFEELVLLQIHLQCFRVGKVVDRLFEFNELLHLLQTALHAAQALIDCLVDWQQVALLPRAVVVALVLHLQMVPHASLAERDLVIHTELVDHEVMFVAVENTGRLLLHLRHLVTVAAVLIVHMLGVHVLRVAVCVLTVCSVPVSWLIHVVTHLYLFTK